MVLPWISSVQYLRIAHDDEHFVLVGLSRDYIQCLLLVNYKRKQIVAMRQILNSLAFKIKDIDFYPNSTQRFVTSGVQHLNFWRLNGRNLQY